MGVSHTPYRVSRRFNLDWMLVTVGLMAAALLAGSLIRTAPGGAEARFGAQMGGLRALSETERLILFEDLGTGADPAWSSGQRQDDHAGLGAVWMAVPPDRPLQRDIALPEGLDRAVLSFDLIALNGWAGESLEVAVQGRTILRHSFSAGGDARQVGDADGITLRTRLSQPRALGLPAGGPVLTEERLSVEIALDQPDPLLRLSVTPHPSATGQVAAAWAVDNLMVIVEGGTP